MSQQSNTICVALQEGMSEIWVLKKKWWHTHKATYDVCRQKRHGWGCLVIILLALACIQLSLMLSVSDIWCDHFILLLPDIRSSHLQPHRVNMTHYSSFLMGGFCNMSKWKKRNTDQMLSHTRFPWIHAVTWQPWCLSVVMDTSVLAAKMMTERQRGLL